MFTSSSVRSLLHRNFTFKCLCLGLRLYREADTDSRTISSLLCHCYLNSNCCQLPYGSKLFECSQLHVAMAQTVQLGSLKPMNLSQLHHGYTVHACSPPTMSSTALCFLQLYVASWLSWLAFTEVFMDSFQAVLL